MVHVHPFATDMLNKQRVYLIISHYFPLNPIKLLQSLYPINSLWISTNFPRNSGRPSSPKHVAAVGGCHRSLPSVIVLVIRISPWESDQPTNGLSYKVVPQLRIAKLKNITPITMVYGRYIYIYYGLGTNL